MTDNITTIIIDWITYNFLNRYTSGKKEEEIEKEILECFIPEDLLNFAKEIYEK